MKNITLSIPDKLLARSRAYAQKQQTTLNQLVRDMLTQIVSHKDPVDGLVETSERFAANTSGYTFNRDEIYNREILR